MKRKDTKSRERVDMKAKKENVLTEAQKVLQNIEHTCHLPQRLVSPNSATGTPPQTTMTAHLAEDENAVAALLQLWQ